MKENYCLQAALVCLSMLYHSQALALERRTHLRPPFHGHHEKGKEGQVLQRSKRGWVWNQFFVIEEYTGPDPVLVGRVRLFAFDVDLSVRVDYQSRRTLPRQMLSKNKKQATRQKRDTIKQKQSNKSQVRKH